MRKSEVLRNLLIQDKLIKLNLDLLEGLLREIKPDIEESKILVEACLAPEERQNLLKILIDFEREFTELISQSLDQIYDLYEIFNFDITFLSNIPEELEREIERLDAVNSINSCLEAMIKLLENILSIAEWDEKTKVILTPLKIYKDVLEHAINFNQRLGLTTVL
ncbi:hypothetical protein [Thermocrinis jamiesonii]|jgi:hypothetical protein|uniref:hypothetical protein n=1 Tax=Thermocrinis jamiesonii TaxID=1302351 RepID=UPI0004959F54|nr:hypothetical protein [Thermocrinis jamiesonii]